MRTAVYHLLIGLIVGSITMPAYAQNGLIPPPQRLVTLAGQFDPGSLSRIALGPRTGSKDKTTLQELQSAFQNAFGKKLLPNAGTVDGTADAGEIWIGDARQATEVEALFGRHGVSLPNDKGPEAYALLILPDRVVISGPTPAARYYGWRTVAQWLDLGRTDCAAIVDWPAYELRGVTDDISRGQVSRPENFKEIIRRLAQLKMNVYMPYLEDMFTFKSYPQIGHDRGAWTPEFARELQDFAERYHVQIIPIFQTLGHYENILIQPEFIHLVEFPGAASLNVSSEETYQFLEKVLGEIIPVFRSRYFHIGADESWDVGKGASRERAQKLGVGKVHVEHYKRVHDIVRRYGKTVMMYGDIVLQHPEILEELPKDMVLFDWHYGPQLQYRSVDVFRDAGFRFVVSPGIHNWARIYPNDVAAMANILHLSLRGLQGGAFGCLTSNWGDYGGANLRELNWFGYTWAAVCSWNPHAAQPDAFRSQFVRYFYGAEIPEIEAAQELLTAASDLTHFPDFWRHPFYEIRPHEERRFLQKRFQLPETAVTAERLIEGGRGQVKRNVEYLEYLNFAARLFGWIGDRADVSLKVEQLRRGLLDSTDSAFLSVLADQCESLATRVKELERQYNSLWLRTNLPANLGYVLELFDRQATYLKVAAEQLRRGVVPPKAELRSRFITDPDAQTEGASIYARKAFTLSKPVEKAILQAIGNDHLRVFVNGKLVGEVYARPCLSIRVEKQRIRTWDVTTLLRRGRNVLAFEAANYDPNDVASGNLYLWVKFADGTTQTVLTDESWRTSLRSNAGWVKAEFDDRRWKAARVADVRWRICEPDFQHNLPSRIEWWE